MYKFLLQVLKIEYNKFSLSNSYSVSSVTKNLKNIKTQFEN